MNACHVPGIVQSHELGKCHLCPNQQNLQSPSSTLNHFQLMDLTLGRKAGSDAYLLPTIWKAKVQQSYCQEKLSKTWKYAKKIIECPFSEVLGTV